MVRIVSASSGTMTDFIDPMRLHDMRVSAEPHPCRCLLSESVGVRRNAFEGLEYVPIPGRMLDDIDDAKPALKNMEDTVSAGNRVAGLVFAPVRAVLMLPGFAETITVTAKPAQDHSTTRRSRVNRNLLANQPPSIDFKGFWLCAIDPFSDMSSKQAATIEGATRRRHDRYR
jgi:hypothetical protein